MRGSRNFRQVGGGGGGGGGGRVNINLPKKALTTLFVCFYVFFLVLSLFYRSQMVNFKEKCNFSRFQRGGSNFFQRGGGVQLFPGGGVQLPIPYRDLYNL